MTNKLTCGECPWKEEDGKIWRICKTRLVTCTTKDDEPECLHRRAYRILRDEVRRLKDQLYDAEQVVEHYACPKMYVRDPKDDIIAEEAKGYARKYWGYEKS